MGTPVPYDYDFVMERLKEFCDGFPLKADAAKALGVSRVFLWKVLSGTAAPTESVLNKIGYTKVRVIKYHYEKLENAS